MAYVEVTKDLTKVKTKVALNLTKRQLICFGAAGAIGIPTFLLLRGSLGNNAAVYIMVAVMLPFFIFGIYEKDDQPLEQYLFNIIKTKIIFTKYRPYKTQNIYGYIEEISKRKEYVNRNGKSGKSTTKKRVASSTAGSKKSSVTADSKGKKGSQVHKKPVQ